MKCNTSRDMENRLSEPEASNSQPQLQAQEPLHGKNSWEARPGHPERQATSPVNTAKAVDTVTAPIHTSESQALTPWKPSEQQQFAQHSHEDISRGDFSVVKSFFQNLGGQYYLGVSFDSKTRWEAPQRQASPSHGLRGKTAENTTVYLPRETQGLWPAERSFKKLKLPNNYQEILKHADSAIDNSSIEKLIKQLHAGVYLDQKTKMYWLNESYSNCFMLFARALTIIWSDTPKYWRWVKANASGTLIDVAELLDVCWLEVRGRMDTKMLLPGMLCQVSFLILLNDQARGWENSVTFRLVLPGGKKQEQREYMTDKSKMRWIAIPVGQFVLSAQDIGDVEISMQGDEGLYWKRGLVIKGVVIKAKN